MLKNAQICMAFLMVTFLVACDNQPMVSGNRSNLMDLPSEDDAKVAYSNLKKIPSHAQGARDRAFSVFLEQDALAEYIVSNEVVPIEDRIAIREMINNFIVTRYVERTMLQRVSEDLLFEYYQNNQEFFGSAIYDVEIFSVKFSPKESEESKNKKMLSLNVMRENILNLAGSTEVENDDHIMASITSLEGNSLEQDMKQELLQLKEGELSTVKISARGASFVKIIRKKITPKDYVEVKSQVKGLFIQKIEKDILKELNMGVNATQISASG